MGASYELVNWLMLGGAALLGLAMGLNHLALIFARRQRREAEREAEQKAEDASSNP